MKLRHLSLALALTFATSQAWSHGTETHSAMQVTPGRETAGAELNVAAAAADAVTTVERFSAALAAGELDKAAAELDPTVLILESGGVERSRDEYLGGHAKNDAEFLKGAHITLKHRAAQASGDLAWVASESEIHAMKGDEMLMIASTETIVLRKSEGGWKIAHIHWSSRRAGGSH